MSVTGCYMSGLLEMTFYHHVSLGTIPREEINWKQWYSWSFEYIRCDIFTSYIFTNILLHLFQIRVLIKALNSIEPYQVSVSFLSHITVILFLSSCWLACCAHLLKRQKVMNIIEALVTKTNVVWYTLSFSLWIYTIRSLAPDDLCIVILNVGLLGALRLQCILKQYFSK